MNPAFNALPKFKVIMVGESGTGKTCIARRYVKGTFDTN